jgi:hypothetical protein
MTRTFVWLLFFSRAWGKKRRPLPCELHLPASALAFSVEGGSLEGRSAEGWRYVVSLCGLPPVPARVDATCRHPSYSYQVTGGGMCYRLADLGRSRAVAPLPGGGLGLEVSFSGGDPCGSSTRTTRVELACGEADGSPLTFSEGPTCTYSARAVGPAGCPLSCGRDEAGAVCGGPLRGVCAAAANGVGAACVCSPGFGGPRCEAGGVAAASAAAVATAAAGTVTADGASPLLPPAHQPRAPLSWAWIFAAAAVAACCFLFLLARGGGAGAKPGEAAPPTALPRRALLRWLHDIFNAPLPSAGDLSFAWWVNTWVRIAATAGAMTVLAMASGAAAPLVSRPGLRIKTVDAIALAEESRDNARGGSGGGGGGGRLPPCYTNPALVNCRRWLDEVLPQERIDIVLFGNELWGQFPLGGYGGIEASVETMAGAMQEMGLPFWVVTPKRVTRPPPRYPFDVLETSHNPNGAGGYVPRYVVEGLNILRMRSNAGGDNVTLVDRAHTAPWRHSRSAPDELGEPRPLVVWGQSDWSQGFAELALVEITTHHDGGGPIGGWDRHLPNVGHRFLSKDQRSRWVSENDVRKKSKMAKWVLCNPPVFSAHPPPPPPPHTHTPSSPFLHPHSSPSILRVRA